MMQHFVAFASSSYGPNFPALLKQEVMYYKKKSRSMIILQEHLLEYLLSASKDKKAFLTQAHFESFENGYNRKAHEALIKNYENKGAFIHDNQNIDTQINADNKFFKKENLRLKLSVNNIGLNTLLINLKMAYNIARLPREELNDQCLSFIQHYCADMFNFTIINNNHFNDNEIFLI